MEYTSKVLSYFYYKKVNSDFIDEGKRKLVLKDPTKFYTQRFSYPKNEESVEERLRIKTGADVTLINRGTIRVTEYIKIVEKSFLPKFEKNWEHVLEKKTLRKNDLQFELTNEGTISIITEIYLFVEDANAFFKEGHLELLSRGCAWESPVIIKENTGTIEKHVEIVAKMGRIHLEELDTMLSSDSSNNQEISTPWEKQIMENHGITWDNLLGIEFSLGSIS